MTQEAGMPTGSDQDQVPTGHAPDGLTPAAPAGGGQALVPVHSVDSIVRRARHHPNATFVAHLIAVDRRVPQLRMHRRAAPADAVAVYAAALTDAPPRAGRKLRRSV